LAPSPRQNERAEQDSVQAHVARALLHLEEALRAYLALGLRSAEERVRSNLGLAARLGTLVGAILAGLSTRVFGRGEILDGALGGPGGGKRLAGGVVALLAVVILGLSVRGLSR